MQKAPYTSAEGAYRHLLSLRKTSWSLLRPVSGLRCAANFQHLRIDILGPRHERPILLGLEQVANGRTPPIPQGRRVVHLRFSCVDTCNEWKRERAHL